MASGSIRNERTISRATATCLRVASEQLPDSQATGPGDARHGPRAAARVGAIAQRARETQRKSRAAGGERQVDAGAPGRDQVLVARRVHDRVRAAFGGKRFQPRTHGVCSCLHVGIRHEPDLARRLRREHADEARVGHRRQRMVAHARVGEQDVADEQVAAIDRAPVARIGRRRGRRQAARRDAERGAQRFGDRADVAARRRVEGRAVLEVDPPGAARAQPRERGQRLRDGVLGRDRARLERDDDRVRDRHGETGIGNAVDLDDGQSLRGRG